MSSKISGLNGPAPTVDAGAGARRSSEAASSEVSGATSSGGPAGSDVHITESANILAGLVQHLRTLPAVDPARVAQFQTAVDSGTYSVQPGTVAEHLMQFEQSLAQMTAG